MSDAKSAFALKDNRDLDAVGAIVINNDRSLNVRDALEQASDGVYVTSDPDEIRVLTDYEPVKRVTVPEPKPAPKKAASGGKED